MGMQQVFGAIFIWSMLMFMIQAYIPSYDTSMEEEELEDIPIIDNMRHCEYMEEEDRSSLFRNNDGPQDDYYYRRNRFGYETTRKPNPIKIECTGFDLIEFNPIKQCETHKCRTLIFTNSNISKILTNDVFEGGLNLEVFDISNTSIKKIEPGAFSNLPNLKRLNLSMNQLTKIGKGTFNSHRNLLVLDLNHNYISEIEEDTFHGSVSIQTLDLSHNKINSLPQDIFKYLGLKILNLSYNYLVTVGDSFCGCLSQLKILKMDNNLLNAIPNCLESSQVFDLSLNFNSIMDFNSSVLPQKLKNFAINSNQLRVINETNFDSFFYLKNLDISDNFLDEFSLDYPNGKSIQTLKISGINLGTVPSYMFTFMIHLKELRMAKNNISSLEKKAFLGASNVKNLDLSENKIDFIQLNVLEDLVSLEVLNVSHNKLEYLQSGVFNGLNKLLNLDLSYNAIELFQLHVFEPLHSLIYLDLKFNKLKTINVEHLANFCPQLMTFNLDGNDFSCMSLANIFARLDKRIFLESGNTISSENINGISCHENTEEHDATENISNFKSFFEKDFKKTSFYNFFNKFDGHKNIDVQNLTSVIGILQSNFSAGFSEDLNVHVKEFMKFENRSFQNFLSELSRIVRKLEDKGKHNESFSIDDLSSSIHNEIKTFVSFENSSFVNFMNKLSEIIEDMGKNRNDSINLNEIMNNLHSLHTNNAEKLISREESEEHVELISAINQLKFFFVFCTFLVLLCIIGLKLYPSVERKYFSTNNYDNNHEMPILP